MNFRQRTRKGRRAGRGGRRPSCWPMDGRVAGFDGFYSVGWNRPWLEVSPDHLSAEVRPSFFEKGLDFGAE